MSSGRWSTPRTATQTLDQIHSNMRTQIPGIQNASDAKSSLYAKGWALPGEEITLETLARTLFSVVADNGKLTPTIANPILSVAYLITERIEDGIKINIAESITKHLLDALIPITADLETKLDTHLKAITKATLTHTEISEKIQNCWAGASIFYILHSTLILPSSGEGSSCWGWLLLLTVVGENKKRYYYTA